MHWVELLKFFRWINSILFEKTWLKSEKGGDVYRKWVCEPAAFIKRLERLLHTTSKHLINVRQDKQDIISIAIVNRVSSNSNVLQGNNSAFSGFEWIYRTVRVGGEKSSNLNILLVIFSVPQPHLYCMVCWRYINTKKEDLDGSWRVRPVTGTQH